MKEKWKKNMQKRYEECMEITEMDITDSTIVVEEHNIKRTLTWHAELEKNIRPYFLDCHNVYTYVFQFQDEQRKSYAVEFSLQEGDIVFLMTISFFNESDLGYLYYRGAGKRGFQILNKESLPTKQYKQVEEKLQHFKSVYENLPEIRLRQLFQEKRV